MAKFRKRSASDSLPEGGLLQLRCGRDFFSNGFGRDVAAMRLAWCDDAIRRRVWQAHRARWGDMGQPWACIAFGDDGSGGVVHVAGDVRESQSLHWERLHPTEACEATQWAYATGRIDQDEYREHLERLSALS